MALAKPQVNGLPSKVLLGWNPVVRLQSHTMGSASDCVSSMAESLLVWLIITILLPVDGTLSFGLCDNRNSFCVIINELFNDRQTEARQRRMRSRLPYEE